MLNSRIVAFYNGKEADHRGRYLHEIQKWPDEQLETVHDYTQWVFPLSEARGFNLAAPVLNRESIQEFRARPDLQEKLRVTEMGKLVYFDLNEEFKEVVIAGYEFLRSVSGH